MRRVVVTGLGLVTPLGCGVKPTWDNILAARSGLVNITLCDVSDMPARVAGEVKRGTEAGQFNPDDWIAPKEQKKMDDFIHFAIAAATQAVQDSGWTPEDEEAKQRTGVLIGSGIGGLHAIEETVL
ncbi:MAG: beta-ketoacyl-ACP synthase II, partial [Rickettsiales bacterium]|nr:beta-ketoacyl-ACP synthase II [Rickettsiales bacterium]